MSNVRPDPKFAKAIIESTDADGNLTTTESNLYTLNINHTATEDIQTSHVITCDPQMHSATLAPGGEPSGWRVINRYNYVTVGDTVISYDVDYYLIDSDGNPTEPGGPERGDRVYGTAANDHLQGMGGNDTINAESGGGNDLLDGGTGQDSLIAGAGNDILIGGADGDIFYGGSGNDRLYADTQLTPEQAIDNGNTQAGSGQKGDWLTGGSGDDTLVGSSGNDVLMGGGGADLLNSGEPDSSLFGGAVNDSKWRMAA